MTDNQIEELKAILNREPIFWYFDNAVRQIISIGPACTINNSISPFLF